MSEKRDWYCRECEKYVDLVEEQYKDLLVEKRQIGKSGNFELYETNIDELDFETVCGYCGKSLTFKG
jgi:hypothetical protein